MRKSPFSKETYTKNAEMYEFMANPKWLEVLNLLKAHGELPVEEIIASMKLSKANVSQNLAVLCHARLVKVRREGVNAYYFHDPLKAADQGNCKFMDVIYKAQIRERERERERES